MAIGSVREKPRRQNMPFVGASPSSRWFLACNPIGRQITPPGSWPSAFAWARRLGRQRHTHGRVPTDRRSERERRGLTPAPLAAAAGDLPLSPPPYRPFPYFLVAGLSRLPELYPPRSIGSQFQSCSPPFYPNTQPAAPKSRAIPPGPRVRPLVGAGIRFRLRRARGSGWRRS